MDELMQLRNGIEHDAPIIYDPPNIAAQVLHTAANRAEFSISGTVSSLYAMSN